MKLQGLDMKESSQSKYMESIKVYGDIRNTLIKTFHEWKGQQYVPNIVHAAIRWSKNDPLF